MKITNIAKGPRGFWVNNRLCTLAPGESVDKDLTADELKGVKGNPESFSTGGADAKTEVKTPDDDENLSQLRSEYQDLYGKRAYHGWTAEELQEKIDAKLGE